MKKAILSKILVAITAALLFCIVPTQTRLPSGFAEGAGSFPANGAEKTAAASKPNPDESNAALASAAQSGANFTNLIVFAKFADETEFIDTVYDGAAVRELIDNTYSVSSYSVSDYFSSASGGKVQMQNLYLFATDGGSVTLSRPRGYYAEKDNLNPDGYETGGQGLRSYELKEDWAQAINAAIAAGAKPTSFDGKKTYPLSELDKTEDGKIDAVTVIYKNATQNISVSWASPLWNYQDNSELVSFPAEDGKNITSSAYVQLTFTYGNADKTFVYTDESGCKFLSQSTAAHETGHIFGLKDLYRSASVSKIYYMSLMGKHLSPVGQFLSVKEREAMGWLSAGQVQPLTGEGSYTVKVGDSAGKSNVIGYKFDLPASGKTLYLEYRDFSGGQNKYDDQQKTVYLSDGSKLKGVTIKSGLVCYLVDTGTKIPNNLGTTGNHWNYEALGGSTATKNDCALAPGDGLDIPGSSLYIKVERMDGEALTFSVFGDELKPAPHVHSLQYVPEIAPTCTKNGQSACYFCPDCGKYFTDADGATEISADVLVLPKAGHVEVVLPGKDPSCEEDGLTQGSKCSVCNEILQKQTVIPAPGHSAGDWIEDKAPTTEEAGHRHKKCVRCSKVLEEEVLPKLPGKEDDKKDDVPGGNKNPLCDFSFVITVTIITGVAVATAMLIVIATVPCS